MVAIAGIRGTGDWGTDERPKNFRELILWRDPNGGAPLTALMSKMRKEVTDDAEYSWWEEELKAIRIKTAGQVINTTTAVTLSIVSTEDATALDVVAGDLLLAESAESTAFAFEIVEVSADPTASNSLVVTRAAAGTTVSTIATSAYLLKIGSAHAEGTGAPTASNRNPVKYYNYTQIFKTVYDMTGTAVETKVRTGDPLKNDKKRKAFDHSIALEQAYMFGHRYETTGSNGKPKRYTAGLYYHLAAVYDATTAPTIRGDVASTATEDDILDALSPMFDYSGAGGAQSNQRIGLCGNGYLNTLNKIANSSGSTRITFNGVIKLFGMQLTHWIIPQGEVFLRSHPLMNTNSRFTNGAFYINPAAIYYRPMKNRDTKPMDNIQANDEDRKKGQWMTEAGVEFHHLRTMLYHYFT